MAGARRKEEKKAANAKGKDKNSQSKARPMWPYMFFSSVPVIAFCIYISIVSPMKKANDAPIAGQVSLDQLEAQMRQMHAGLAGVAGKGDSDIFKKIRNMASVAEDVLTRAGSAPTERERRAILEQGMEARSEMLEALLERSTELHKQEDDDRQANAPLSVDPAGHVAQLTKDTFASYMARNPQTMVEFYAPWCGHCKKFAPEFERVAEQFEGRAGFAAVDATEQDMLARVYGIAGYPTLKWFFRGHVVQDYAGPRTAVGIGEWLERHLELAYSELEESVDLTEALQMGDASSIAICAGAGAKGSSVHLAFEVAAEQFRGKFLFVWSPADSESIEVHQRDKDAVSCLDDGSPCATVDKVVEWLQAIQALTVS